MFYADTVGLYNVLAAMRRYAKGYQGEAWEPAPLLVKLAEAGKSFNPVIDAVTCAARIATHSRNPP